MRREWIEMPPFVFGSGGCTSPSMRREWIEISCAEKSLLTAAVSLHAEGVD